MMIYPFCLLKNSFNPSPGLSLKSCINTNPQLAMLPKATNNISHIVVNNPIVTAIDAWFFIRYSNQHITQVIG